MYTRILKPVKDKCFFLFGPRGTGKTTWVKTTYSDAIYLDLLRSELFTRLISDPGRLEQYILPNYQGYVVIDEVQRVPELLNEVHRLIEDRKIKFVLTGSSARKIRRGGYNLLAGRALSYQMYPLTAIEMGDDFNLGRSVIRGMLPMAQVDGYGEYLKSYIQTYLEQEIMQEGLTRNLSAFARFLEVASFSQGQLLNMASISRDVGVGRKVISGYFTILQDLLIGYLIKPFTKRSKRRLVSHAKFYFFDCGVYRAIRPTGPLDSGDEVSGIATESLVLSQLMANNDLLKLGYEVNYYRTATGVEVDFVLYGKRGLVAIEVKKSGKFKEGMISGLKRFKLDYPEAKLYLLYGGSQELYVNGVTVMSLEKALKEMDKWL
ncbi:AAA family ATPase [Patescibacteria group bacterium]|nr:AAA family ATPase [Patescibacteria group bacterium]MCG2702553.1 AAA family ATPase [Candidatus Parcubacteria bacterium]MBU4265097.1 AAA family ATPase [Patescibacteria group bacterium]MBU4389663.1 AAA family ATPase [Patescibacteria group bacterium]MBU4396789.1 AAA family ATPase [Patescibacteria group bacterium]